MRFATSLAIVFAMLLSTATLAEFDKVKPQELEKIKEALPEKAPATKMLPSKLPAVFGRPDNKRNLSRMCWACALTTSTSGTTPSPPSPL